MTKLDEEILMAYVDGELDPQRVTEVEALLAEDAEARATVQIFRDSAATLRGAFDDMLREPVPTRLLAAVKASPTGSVSDLRLARRQRPSRFFPATTWAQAAAVALLVGAGYMAAQWTSRVLEPSAQVATVDPLLNEALETIASGSVFARQEQEGSIRRDIMPLLTFRDANDRYCREFESTLKVPDDQQVSYGVACRERGVWQPQALMARPLIAPTLRDGPAADQSQYVPAMGSDVVGFDTVIQKLIVGEPLSAEEETALLSRGWR